MIVDLYPDLPKMPQEQVNAMFLEVQEGMTGQIAPSLTEMYFPSASDPDFMENGTGAFVDMGGAKLLVSNQHVVNNEGLHHSFYGYDSFVPAALERHDLGEPIDIGAVKIQDDLWVRYARSATAIPLNRFADRHNPVPVEFLWTAGYPGDRIKHFATVSLAVCQAHPTQEYIFHDDVKPHEKFDPKFHFAVGYSPEMAQKFDIPGSSSSPGLSDPHGLSGSLVWNTRRLECFHKGEPWDQSLAVVTGIVWGWPGSNYLIATKVEHFRKFLTEVSKR